MNKEFRPVVALAVFIVCANLGEEPSNNVAGGHKPTINFYGDFTNTKGMTYQIENIRIKGMYKQIPVYDIPPNKNTDPRSYITTDIDPAEISVLSVPHPDQSKKYGDRDYIEIIITKKSGKQDSYLIESTATIACDKVDKDNPDETTIHFQALKDLHIKGYKKNVDPEEAKKEKDAKESLHNPIKGTPAT